jgi:putative transposase
MADTCGVTDDTPRREDDQALQLALFRYGLVTLVLDAGPGRPISQVVREVSARPHLRAGVGEVTVAERTLWAWVGAWKREGLCGLLPRFRKDRGSLRALTTADIERAIQLRKDNSDRFTSTLLDILRLEGQFQERRPPHRATLDRHLLRQGASRRQLQVLGAKRTIKMSFERFGQLWVGDYHHGPLVRDPDNRPVVAKLGAFIDHATRYPVASRWYLAEDVASLRDTLLRALLVWGPPEVAYADNGAVYRAEQLAWSLDQIKTRLVHSRPYYSQGRGVIERWWQLSEAFEAEVRQREELLDLHELNQFWEAWREERYCAVVHSALGRSPNDAVAEVVRRPLDPDVARELFMLRAERTVHKKDGCVAVEGRRFLCESFLRGRKVEVRYDPGDLSAVLVFVDKKRVQRALPQPLNARPEPHPEAPEKSWQSADYLALLRADFDRKLLEHARPLAYADLVPDTRFDHDQFVRTLVDLAGIATREPEKQELRQFWDTHGPLPEDLVRIAAEHATRLRGRGRHVRVYLHAIQTLVLAHWKKPKERP